MHCLTHCVASLTLHILSIHSLSFSLSLNFLCLILHQIDYRLKMGTVCTPAEDTNHDRPLSKNARRIKVAQSDPKGLQFEPILTVSQDVETGFDANTSINVQ